MHIQLHQPTVVDIERGVSRFVGRRFQFPPSEIAEVFFRWAEQPVGIAMLQCGVMLTWKWSRRRQCFIWTVSI